MIRAVVLALVMLASIAAQPRAADACSCRARPSACEGLTEGVAFLGTVTEIETSNFDDTVHFDVTEAFTGSIGKTAVVVTTPMSCGYRFAVGTSYMVYGHQGLGGLISVSHCTRTAPADQAKEDLVVARAKPTAKQSLAVVEGTVTIKDDEQGKANAGLTVQVRGTAISAKTSSTGAFTLRLPVGTHVLDIVSQELRIAGAKDVEIHVPTPLVCPHPRIQAAWNGRITGRLTDRKNRPRAGVWVVAARRARSMTPRTEVTDADGRYAFADVAPGPYEIAVSPKRSGGVTEYSPYPTTVYPGDVVVPRGGVAADISFQLPDPVPVHTVSGVVRSHDGTAAEGAMVTIVWSPDYNQVDVANGGGGYEMRVLHGSTVSIRACWHEAPGGMKCTARAVTKKITKATTVDLRLAR